MSGQYELTEKENELLMRILLRHNSDINLHDDEISFNRANEREWYIQIN